MESGTIANTAQTQISYKSINEVIVELESIVMQCMAGSNRAGYFAVLYYYVTTRVKEGIAAGDFQDGKRMERLDVLFASRYINAWQNWNAGLPITSSWKIAFETAESDTPIVMQHLLLGMNAHINLDLGIAAVEVMQGLSLPDLKKDFDEINEILASLVDEMEDRITTICPLLFLLNLHKTNLDEMLVQFSMDTARNGAWKYANELFALSGDAYNASINQRDGCIAKLARSIASPGGALRNTVRFIRMFEKKNVVKVMGILQGT